MARIQDAGTEVVQVRRGGWGEGAARDAARPEHGLGSPPRAQPAPYDAHTLARAQAKAGAGSATLSMAAAAARFCAACLRAMGGQAGVVECAYVASSLTDLPYFASQLRLGPAGVEGALARRGGWGACVGLAGQHLAAKDAAHRKALAAGRPWRDQQRTVFQPTRPPAHQPRLPQSSCRCRA